jgi:hypothetical protein
MSECGMGNSDIKPEIVQPVGNSETSVTNKCTGSSSYPLHHPMDESVCSINKSNVKVTQPPEHRHYSKCLDQRRQEIGVKCLLQKTAMNVSVFEFHILLHIKIIFIFLYSSFNIIAVYDL